MQTIVDATGQYLTGIAGNIVDAFNSIVVDSTTGGLTNFAVWALVFGGVTAAAGVVGAIIRKVG